MLTVEGIEKKEDLRGKDGNACSTKTRLSRGLKYFDFFDIREPSTNTSSQNVQLPEHSTTYLLQIWQKLKQTNVIDVITRN